MRPFDEKRRIWRLAAVADYIALCDEALEAELARRNGAWPGWLIIPHVAPSDRRRAALAHWLDEIRRKHNKPLRIYFETPGTGSEPFPAA